LSTWKACPGMEKLFVIRCVVPLIVSTPATATASQNRATTALWRSTKRVMAGIAASWLLTGGVSAGTRNTAGRGTLPASGRG
jgi:hypothetical protein